MSPVPAFDLDRAYGEIERDLDVRWRAILESKHFVGGEEVGQFERNFARYLEVPECVGVANGTDALILAIRALGARPGDEVIVPAFTFAATGATVALVGAEPVFADVEPATFNLDPSALEEMVTSRTVGVIGVHLYGTPFALEAVLEICRARGLWLIEDAAQAHGARFAGRRVGSFGDLATWSFYPSKNLGCFGDGGAVTATNPDLLDRVRLLANHGSRERYQHLEIGTNSRLDSFQAAVLNTRLPLLEEKNARRREIAAAYLDGLADLAALGCLRLPETVESVFHQMVVLSPRRDELREFLSERGIGTAVHYPAPLPEQPCFANAPGNRGRYPEASRAAREALCLPMFPELSNEEVEEVIAALRRFDAT